MTDYRKLQARCQRGEGRIADANDLLAECYGAFGQLFAEKELLLRAGESLTDQIKQLKAENEALRKDAERYQWLRDKSESVHQFYLSTPIWFTGVRFSKENVDSTIDAAMGKGDNS